MAELVPLKVAQERLEISKNTMRKLVRDRGFTLYENPLDARQKLIDWEEVEAALRPRPIRPKNVDTGKAAA